VEHCTECGKEITGKSLNGNHICIACFKQRELKAGNASFYTIYQSKGKKDGLTQFELYQDGFCTIEAARVTAATLQAVKPRTEVRILLYASRKAPFRIYE
jgi:hypothetical protein